MNEIQWSSNSQELATLTRIAKRARDLAAKNGVVYSYGDALMDLEACHCNGNRLRLSDLEEADDANFGHDVFGIRRYLDRSTGQLTDCFVPRFSAAS